MYSPFSPTVSTVKPEENSLYLDCTYLIFLRLYMQSVPSYQAVIICDFPATAGHDISVEELIILFYHIGLVYQQYLQTLVQAISFKSFFSF